MRFALVTARRATVDGATETDLCAGPFATSGLARLWIMAHRATRARIVCGVGADADAVAAAIAATGAATVLLRPTGPDGLPAMPTADEVKAARRAAGFRSEREINHAIDALAARAARRR